MPGASDIKAGGAWIEIGAVTAPLRVALKTSARMVKGFLAGVKVAARATVAAGKRMAAAMRRVGSAIRGAAGRLKQFAVTGIRRGIIALTAVLGAASFKAINFEAAMARVNTIFGMSAGELKKFNQALLGMAGRVGKAPAQLADALYQVGSAGVEASKSIAFLEAATKSAIAGVTDSFTAVNILTTLLNAYSISADQAMSVSDILFETVRQGKTTFNELAASIGRVAPIASSAGISLNEVGAAVATLTKGGLSTDEAMTGLRATIISILKPTKSSSELAKKLGIDLSVAALQSKGLGQTLLDVGKATKGSTELIAQLFPNVRALNAVLSLSVAQADEYSRQMKIMQDVTGATDKAFQEIDRTIQQRLKKAYASMSASLIRIGRVFMPMVARSAESMANVFGKVADWFETHSEDIQAAIEAVASWIQARLGDIRGVVGEFLNAIKGDNETAWEAVKQIVESAWNRIKSIWSGAGELLKPAIEIIRKAAAGEWAGAWEDIKTYARRALDATLDILEEYIPKFVDFGLKLLSALMDGLTAKDEAGKSIIGRVTEMMTKIVAKLFMWVGENLDQFVMIGVEMGRGIAKGIWQALKEVPGGIYRGLRETGEYLMGVEEPREGISPEMQERIRRRRQGVVNGEADRGQRVNPATGELEDRPVRPTTQTTINITQPQSPQDINAAMTREILRGRI